MLSRLSDATSCNKSKRDLSELIYIFALNVIGMNTFDTGIIVAILLGMSFLGVTSRQ